MNENFESAGQEKYEEEASTTFAVIDPCAALRRASRAVTHLYDLIFSPMGLKSTQFVLLNAIHRRGEIAQWQLADEYGLGADTLSRRLATLRRAGLIQRQRGKERRGENVYKLTNAGMDKHRKALPCWLRAQQRLRLVLGDQQWDSLIRMANEVVVQARYAESARVCNLAPSGPLPSMVRAVKEQTESAAA